MGYFLQVRSASANWPVPLTEARLSVGSSLSNDLALDGDPAVSRLHAVLERYSSGWSVRDVGSLNGTLVNGRRIEAERRLHVGDVIQVGTTELILGSDLPLPPGPRTAPLQDARAPTLTRREVEVVTALCAPILDGDVFTEPASIRTIAARLHITEAGVKQHLGRLYDKFGLREDADRRRTALANEVMRRGVLTIVDLRAAQAGSQPG